MYFCPYCDQKSTRRWNLETHIKRRHSGTGSPIPKLQNVTFQSPNNNWLGDFKSKYPNNFFSNSKGDPLDPRNIIEFLRIVSPYLTPGPYGALPVNVGSLDGRTTLGFKGYVCNKCFYYWCKQIFDDEEGISLKSDHTCDPQKLHEAHRYTDIAETMHKKRQELISLITYVFNNPTTQQELLDLTAVEIPSSVFNNRSDSDEEYVDLDALPFGTPYWAYAALKEGKTVINTTDLAEFLDIFGATLGFLRLTIDGVKHYFFVYIAKGLEPKDIKYLKKFLDAPITTGISIVMGNSVINKIHVDIRLNKFSSFETVNDSVNHKMWDEIPERQDALLVPLIKQQSYISQFLTSLGYAENPVLRLVSILEKEEKKGVNLRFNPILVSKPLA